MLTEPNSIAEIETLLFKLVKKASVEDPDCIIASDTVPSKDIKGFDSLTGLEVLTELEEESGIHVDEDVFYSGTKPRRYRPIHEVAIAVWNQIHKGGQTYA